MHSSSEEVELGTSGACPQSADSGATVEQGREIGSSFSMLMEEDPGWDSMYQQLMKRDAATIADWKDELNNTVIFAALFSAVVAAFTIDSYKWLQPDSGAVTNQLLATISLQLSGASAGESVNLTTPALLVQNVTAEFIPDQFSVKVNTLWFISLTLSLLVALFAITAQQWLRNLRLPLNLPLRTSFVLRQRLHVRVERWRVPAIISVLPLLLQVALICFLVGLLIVLRTIDHTVADTFAVVSVTGIAIFVIMILLPLVFPSCVYRSPVVPTLFALWHAIKLLMAIPCLVLVSIANTRATVLRPLTSILHRSSLQLYAKKTVARATLRLSSFRHGAIVFSRPFWLDRDLQAYTGDARHATDQALRDIVVNAPLEISAFALVKDAISAYDPVKRARLILLSFIKSLNFSTVVDVFDNLTPDLGSTEQFRHRASHCISAPQIRMLMHTLQPESIAAVWSNKRFHNFFVYPLVCAHQAAKGASTQFRQAFCAYLWDIHVRRAAQETDIASISAKRLIPTATLILDFGRGATHEPNVEETIQAVRWAQRLNETIVPPVFVAELPLFARSDEYSTSSPRVQQAAGVPISPVELSLCNRNEILATNAVAFMALAGQPHSLVDETLDRFARSLLALLLVPAYTDLIREDARNADKARATKARIIPLFDTVSDAMLGMSSSIISLLLTSEHASADVSLRQLASRLCELCDLLKADRADPELAQTAQRLGSIA